MVPVVFLVLPITILFALYPGLLAITAGDNVLRLAPPLVLTDADCAEATTMLRRAAQRCQPSAAKVAAK